MLLAYHAILHVFLNYALSHLSICLCLLHVGSVMLSEIEQHSKGGFTVT